MVIALLGFSLTFQRPLILLTTSYYYKNYIFYWIQDSTLSWFENYLSNKKQFVTYNGNKSKTEKINCGVPQGSTLGPLLFLLYINDLSTVSGACMSILFADDTNMFYWKESTNNGNSNQ